jgi:hypothetical protein
MDKKLLLISLIFVISSIFSAGDKTKNTEFKTRYIVRIDTGAMKGFNNFNKMVERIRTDLQDPAIKSEDKQAYLTRLAIMKSIQDRISSCFISEIKRLLEKPNEQKLKDSDIKRDLENNEKKFVETEYQRNLSISSEELKNAQVKATDIESLVQQLVPCEIFAGLLRKTARGRIGFTPLYVDPKTSLMINYYLAIVESALSIVYSPLSIQEKRDKIKNLEQEFDAHKNLGDPEAKEALKTILFKTIENFLPLQKLTSPEAIYSLSIELRNLPIK